MKIFLLTFQGNKDKFFFHFNKMILNEDRFNKEREKNYTFGYFIKSNCVNDATSVLFFVGDRLVDKEKLLKSL